MKRILIILCSIMLIVFGLFIYNQYAGGGKHGIDKVEQLRLETKQNVEEIKKDIKENIRGEEKDDEGKDKRDDKDGKKKKAKD